MDDQISLLDIEGVDPPGDAIRDIIDPDKVRELAESIRSQGLLQPILVRPVNNRFEVVVGHRRYLAHRLIGEVKIKAIVKEVSDEECIIVRAIENDQREDLNPIEKGKIYKRLHDELNYSFEKVAQKMGRNKMTVLKYVHLLDVPEEFHKAIAEKRVAMDVMIILNEIEDVEFKRYYMENAIQNGITTDIARMWVSDYGKSRIGSYYKEDGGEGGLQEIPEPTPTFGTCHSCFGAVDVTRLRYIPVCGVCEKALKGSRLGKI